MSVNVVVREESAFLFASSCYVAAGSMDLACHCNSDRSAKFEGALELGGANDATEHLA